MAKKSRTKPSLYLTERALHDIASIERYSIKQFGQSTANQYLDKLEASIGRILAEPDVLREEPAFHDSLKFYRVEKHLLVCETGIEGRIIVIAVIHASMDIPARLAELEPKLALEVEFLLAELKRSDRT